MPAARSTDARRGALLVLGAALCWGTTGTARALGAPEADPLGVGAVRLAIGGLLLVLVAWRAGALERALLRPAGLAAAVAVAAYQLTFFAAVARVGVALGTVVAIGSAPLATGLLAALGGDRPARRWYLATLLALVGVAALLGPGADARLDPLGLALALGAGAAYAGYAVGAKRLLREARPEGAMAVAFGGGAVLLLPLLLTSDLGWLAAPQGTAAAIWLGVVTTTLAYVLFGRGLSGLAASTAATLSLLEPVTAAALGVVLLGERLGPLQWAGVALVLGSLFVVAGRPARAPDP